MDSEVNIIDISEILANRVPEWQHMVDRAINGDEILAREVLVEVFPQVLGIAFWLYEEHLALLREGAAPDPAQPVMGGDTDFDGWLDKET